MTALAHDTRAPCEQDPELFHSPDHEGRQARIDREAAAKALCAMCPVAVKADCLSIAMKAENGNGAQHREGIYAGLTPTERAALDGRGVAAKPKAECGTSRGYDRHRHAGEEACQPCKDAKALRARRKRAAA